MRIRDLAHAPFRGCHRTRAGNWYVEDDYTISPLVHYQRTLFHHGTAMLRWDPSWPVSDPPVRVLSMGWGSVSDQNGCNQILRELGVRSTYRRAGGYARYEPY